MKGFEVKDLKVDFKIIVITIGIAILIGTLIWAGINIYKELNGDENRNIEYFEGDGNLNIESMGSIENNEVDDEFFIQPNLEKKFQINNSNYSEGPSEWAKITVNKTKNTLRYAIPDSSKEILLEFITTREIDMSQWTEDGTYEDFIQDFCERVESYDISSDIEITTRKINIGGKEFYVIMLGDDNVIGSYFCLAKDGCLYSLEVFVARKYYNNNVQNTIDKIFSTFTIIKREEN